MNPDTGIATLKVNGAIYGGWKTVRARRSIEDMSGSFNLTITERWPGQPESSPIRHGYACQLLLDGEPVITGYVDDVHPGYGASDHTITVSGRDKTGDLVDCSAIYKTGQWFKAKLEQIARDLIAPFGIKLVVDADTGAAFSSFNIQEGETVFECLDRAARMRGVLLTSNVLGDLVITRAGKARVTSALVEGQNILKADGAFSAKDRYSRYIVKSQERLGPDGDSAETRGSSKSVVTDDGVSRYRPLIVLAEEHGDGAAMSDRAHWERNVRRGRGNAATLTVQGWRQASGDLWQPNLVVPVFSPWLWLDADMLISACTWAMDSDNGTTTELEIAQKEAFDVLMSRGASGKGGRANRNDWSML